MVSVPLFGAARLSSHPGNHAVLLDGERGSFAFSTGSADDLLSGTNQLSWSWSSNLRHALVFDATKRRLFVRRWDKPGDIQDHPNPDAQDAGRLFEALAVTEAPSAPTVIDRMITVFRIVRTNVEELGGTALEVLHAFNALLVITSATKRGEITVSERVTVQTLGDALALVEQRRLAGLTPADVSTPVQRLDIQQLTNALVAQDVATQYDLDPDLLVRHAAGALYQEAHAELRRVRPSFQQRSLFVTLDAPPTTVATGSEYHFTPPSLARALVQEAVLALSTLRGEPDHLECLDPACGSGVFLIEALREIGIVRGGGMELRGIDSSSVSCAMTSFCLRRVVRDETGVRDRITVSIRSEDSLMSESWGAPDIILMNPPFTAWRYMADDERRVVRGVLGKTYYGRPDKASAFLWRAIRSLRPGAVLATLVPATFLGSSAARRIRKAILADQSLNLHLVGYFQGGAYFSNARVEPAFLVISRSGGSSSSVKGEVKLVLAKAGSEDRAIRELRKGPPSIAGPSGVDGWEFYTADRRSLSAESWMPRPRRANVIAATLEKRNTPRVQDLFAVKLGIRTGKNDVFVITEEGLRQLSASEPERELFRPVIARRDAIRSGVIHHGEYVFYPYGKDGSPLFADEAEVALAAPKYYDAILKPNKEILSKRKSLRDRKWWELVEPRTTWLSASRPKLVSSYFGGVGKFGYDDDGGFAVLQGFGWLWKGDSFKGAELPYAYLALLNSPAFEGLLALSCPRVEWGQLDLSPRFVNGVFVPNLAATTQSDANVTTLAQMGRSIAKGVFPAKELLNNAVALAYGVSVEELSGELEAASSKSVATAIESVEARFRRLVRQWKRDTAHLSVIGRMVKLPAYREIINMGQPVIPLLLAELRSRPDFWFEALEAITGKDPVPSQSAGKVREMARAWIEWGRSEGYVQ